MVPAVLRLTKWLRAAVSSVTLNLGKRCLIQEVEMDKKGRAPVVNLVSPIAKAKDVTMSELKRGEDKEYTKAFVGQSRRKQYL